MKIIYSHLKKLLPNLTKEPQQLRDDLTMIEHFTNYFEKINDEIIFDLDIKVNRGDCLGYYGLARDLSVYYNLDLNLPKVELPSPSNKIDLPIKVTTDNVKRVMAIRISDLENKESPKWLKDFVEYHGTNSVNTLVDLTNYIMFLYGLPPHAFDTSKSTNQLIWQMNPGFKEFKSLDESILKLHKNVLMINNPDKALSLSFWGGEACAIQLDTKETIIEIAVYNPATVRQNSRSLKATTEAGTRLEKILDPDTIPLAFNHLISLILKHCNGHISSNIFDYYPNKRNLPQIEFDPQKASKISGIEIPVDFAFNCLKKIGCTIKNNLITPPSIRTDINIEADLIEEVIRFWGYQKIPTNQALSFKDLEDITPKEIYLIEELKDKLIGLGYDEILSWPISDETNNLDTVIKIQNSINTELIYLRQSLVPSLKKQLAQYQRFKLNSSQFFEIATIFSKKGDKYIEKNSLALYCNDINKLQEDLKTLNLETESTDSNFVEIIIDNLDRPKEYQPKIINHSAYELTSQLIILDANLTLKEKEDPIKLIKKYTKIINSDHLWEIIITDIYNDPKKEIYRYTFHVSYFNINDKEAKKIHLKAFNLENK